MARSINIDFPEEININQYRAPTDESIRILAEMQEKTMRSVVGQLQVSINDLKVDLVCFSFKQSIGLNPVFYLAFELNGRKYNKRLDVDPILANDIVRLVVSKRYNNFNKVDFSNYMTNVLAGILAKYLIGSGQVKIKIND